NYCDHIVRPGDTSLSGLREKVGFVLDQIEARLAAIGFGWRDTTATQVYTVRDFHPLAAEEIVARGAADQGITWHYSRPPVIGLDFEMDCRRVYHETVI